MLLTIQSNDPGRVAVLEARAARGVTGVSTSSRKIAEREADDQRPEAALRVQPLA